MKFILSFIVAQFAMATLTVAQQPSIGNLDYLDYKNGYKDIILGDSLDLSICKLLGSDDGVDIYDVTDSTYFQIGDILIKSVGIAAYEGRVLFVSLSFDHNSSSNLYTLFKEAYGIYSDKPNRFMDKYEWEGEDIKLTLDYDNEYEDGSAIFLSKTLLKKRFDDRELKAKNAISDL